MMICHASALTVADVEKAHARIIPYIHRTPILTSRTLDSQFGAQLLFKCENFQRSGSFKARGAFNAVISLTNTEVARGVVTSSSGNQAAALSLAAKARGVPAYVAMPRSAAMNKVAAVKRYDGKIIWIDTKSEYPTSEEFEATVRDIERETRAAHVHPYNDDRTIAGQGTCTLEFVGDAQDLDLLLAPVGGGGLLAGTALTAKGASTTIQVVGCEPEAADDAQRSLQMGHIVPQLQPRTIADGLRTSLGDLTFRLMSSYVDDVVTVPEESIVRAMRLLWDVLKIIVEPSSAVPLAALLEGRVSIAGKKVGIIISGGNVDLDRLPWIE